MVPPRLPAGRGVLSRLLVLVVVGLTTVILTDAPAHACSCTRLTLAQQVKKADGVFSGTVTMASGPTNVRKRQVMSYDVKVDRVYKGDITTLQVTVKSDADPSACGLANLSADNRYLFFVRANGTNLLASSCGGTSPANVTKTQKLVALLGQGSTPVPPTPAAATFSRVAGAEPPSLTRLAVPGAALLVIGLLGLMVFGQLGRSRRP